MDEAWLNTVRLARDCGDISSLFPPGITRLWDLPHTLHTAIRVALHYLRIEDSPHLEESEKPPRHIWLDPEKMERWWREVKADREAKAPGGGSVRDMPQNKLLDEIFPGVNFG